MPRGRFVNRPYENLENQQLLASFLNCNCNGNCHSDHGVVTGSNQAHYFRAVGNSFGLRSLICLRCDSDRLFKQADEIRIGSKPAKYANLVDGLSRTEQSAGV